eukprot:10786379-Lingulodinium_polyedra.AAC.1
MALYTRSPATKNAPQPRHNGLAGCNSEPQTDRHDPAHSAQRTVASPTRCRPELYKPAEISFIAR